MRRRLIWLIYPSYTAITIFALALVGVLAARELRQAYVEQAEIDLRVRSRMLAELAAPNRSSPAELDRLCKKLGAETDTRFTLIAPDGRVLADSEADPAQMENHLGRPEVAAALASGSGLDLRHSHTTGRDMLYVAVTLSPSGRPVLIARSAQPLASISEVLRVNYEKIALAAVLAAALATAMSWLVARRLQAALSNLREGAARFASGDLNFRVRAPESEEFSDLAENLNRMAGELEHRIQTVKKLEIVRRDFVANVSHELKTPLTSIKAAVETLKSGVGPAEAERFVDMILRHADRLNAIIDDLLSLSRIEQGEDRDEIGLTPGHVGEVLKAAMAALEGPARDKDIRIALDCRPELSARMNAALLEQAVINLLDNAIKYSDAGTAVRVRAGMANGRVEIAVEDEGPGIPAEHLDRIFERFYRVDKARSRKLGGTGLGLSIARHIVNAHGGEIQVRSEVGKGSTFTIFLPNPN